MDGTTETGTVRWFGKSFGFIAPDDAGNRVGAEDLFVHFTAIQGNGFRSLTPGQHVQYRRVFDPARGEERAVDVAVIGRED